MKMEERPVTTELAKTATICRQVLFTSRPGREPEATDPLTKTMSQRVADHPQLARYVHRCIHMNRASFGG
jgi:hypothetical protein